jgi:hypothetical protein
MWVRTVGLKQQEWRKNVNSNGKNRGFKKKRERQGDSMSLHPSSWLLRQREMRSRGRLTKRGALNGKKKKRNASSTKWFMTWQSREFENSMNVET